MSLTKIVYLTPLYFHENSYLGGGERYPLNLARGVLAHANGEETVELISYGPRAHLETIQPGLTLRVLPVARPPRNSLDAVSWELPEAIADASLVHIQQAFTRGAEVGLLAAKQQRKPVCLTDHGGVSSTLGLQLGTLDLADRIICQSQFAAGLLHTSTLIEVIPGGVDSQLFLPPPVRMRRDRVLFVGRLLPHKGIDQLIAALPSDLPLTICGRPYHEAYYQYLQQLSKDKWVEFITDADDERIRQLYARAWVNVLPSVYRDCYGQTHQAPELMGFTLLESMACGTPVICSRVGAMPEFVQEGVTGFIFDDIPGLSSRLLQLAKDPDLVEGMGSRARQIVEQEFDLRVAGRKLRTIYHQLIAKAKELAA